MTHLAEPKTYSKSEVLEIVRKSNIELINRIHDPNSEANILMAKKMKEITDAEISRQVEQRMKGERETIGNELDRLQSNYDEVVKVIGCIKGTHDALLQKLDAIQQREENSTRLYETMVKLTASLQNTSEAFARMLNLLERKTGTKKTGGV